MLRVVESGSEMQVEVKYLKFEDLPGAKKAPFPSFYHQFFCIWMANIEYINNIWEGLGFWLTESG